MKEILKDLISSNVNTWTDNDIYAISLYTYNDMDNPCKPTVMLGYNTDSQVKNVIDSLAAETDLDAKWDFNFWLQNEYFFFGLEDSQSDVMQWLEDNNLPYYDDDDEAWAKPGTARTAAAITTKFIAVLAEIIKEVHDSKILTAKFGKELPILIHDNECTEQVAVINFQANGEELLGDYMDFCNARF